MIVHNPYKPGKHTRRVKRGFMEDVCTKETQGKLVEWGTTSLSYGARGGRWGCGFEARNIKRFGREGGWDSKQWKLGSHRDGLDWTA